MHVLLLILYSINCAIVEWNQTLQNQNRQSSIVIAAYQEGREIGKMIFSIVKYLCCYCHHPPLLHPVITVAGVEQPSSPHRLDVHTALVFRNAYSRRTLARQDRSKRHRPPPHPPLLPAPTSASQERSPGHPSPPRDSQAPHPGPARCSLHRTFILDTLTHTCTLARTHTHTHTHTRISSHYYYAEENISNIQIRVESCQCSSSLLLHSVDQNLKNIQEVLHCVTKIQN